MYCSTCGSRVAGGRRECDTCGAAVFAPVRAPVAPLSPATGGPLPAAPVGLCARCGHHGEGLPYFSRGTHVAALVGLSIFTAGMMGMGGVAYYLFRRRHQVCPRCGFGWGVPGERPLLQPGPAGPAPASSGTSESFLRGWAVALFLLAALLAVVGVAQTAAPALAVAGAVAAGGLLLQRAAEKRRERRRDALLSSLQLPVLRLAAERGGRLTVTDVATALQWPLRRAERVLRSLDDGLRVDSAVTDEGLIVYEFLEIVHAPDRLSGPGGDPAL